MRLTGRSKPKDVAQAEAAVRRAEDALARLDADLERASSDIAVAEARRPEVEELLAKVYLEGADPAAAEAAHAETEGTLRLARAGRARLGAGRAALERELEAANDAVIEARQTVAIADWQQAHEKQVEKSAELDSALSKADEIAGELIRAREATAAKASVVRELGAAVPQVGDEAEFSSGLKTLLRVVEEGPRRPSDDAHRAAEIARSQRREVLGWAQRQGEVGAGWASVEAQVPAELLEQARTAYDRGAAARQAARERLEAEAASRTIPRLSHPLASTRHLHR